jgi:hypothetical protein
MATDGLARRRRLLALVAVSAFVAIVCAVVNSGVIGGFPPKLRLHNLQIAVATSHIYTDLPGDTPLLPFRRADPPEDLQTMIKRGELLGRIMVSPPVLALVAQRCGAAPGDISGLGRITTSAPSALTEPDSEKRASDIAASKAPYRVEVQARPTMPVIDVYTQAPSLAGATCLADAAPRALSSFLGKLALADNSPYPVMRLKPLGPARGGVANGGATLIVALLTFLTVFGVLLATLIGVGEWRRRRRRAASHGGVPAAPLVVPEPVHAVPAPARERDSWPFTTRLLPWMLAGFIALLWLTPFNNIQLSASLPIELRLDRLVLPFVAIVWLLALVAGGRVAPRLRVTWIHVALGALLACAFLSVVTDARYLNQSLELDLSLKKLPLIVSYASFFVIAASSVRRSEVRPFMNYTLVLAVICGLGMIVEYRMQTNIFWDWSAKLLPGFFSIDGQMPGGVVDHIGRRVVRGPAEVPLEAVAMLTMALPIAIVGILQSRRWRQRILYALALCIIVAATFATYRKSALVAPVAVILTLAYFRRRELLKLAPLGLVLLALVSAVSPGAIGSTISQFTRSDAAAVPTVSDRASDYDAVRPDVLGHLILGRGWGSYNHDSYRILDSEILSRTIEAGLLGLIAFLLLGITVVVTSRRTIASRDPTSAPIALIGASIAVGFLVLATLFDELSFPHPVYIFLYMVGLVTVVLRPEWRPPERRRMPAPRAMPFDQLEPEAAVVAQAPAVPAR